MTNLAPIAPKLGSLIRLLASDVPGEVVATASAIKRMLKKLGGDFHTLADLVEHANGHSNGANISEEDMKRLHDAGYVSGFEAGLKHAAAEQRKDNGFTNTDGTVCWRDIAAFCQKHRQRLQDRERKFVDDMAEQTRFRNDLTEKQQSWLRSIYLRLGGDFARVKGSV